MGDIELRVPTGPIQIRPGEAGRLIMLFPYTPERVAKIKTFVGRRWHREEKYWMVPHTEEALAYLLALFAGGSVTVDPSLRSVRAPDNREPPHGPALLQDVSATMIYTHLLNQGGHGVYSPADRL